MDTLVAVGLIDLLFYNEQKLSDPTHAHHVINLWQNKQIYVINNKRDLLNLLHS